MERPGSLSLPVRVYERNVQIIKEDNHVSCN